MYLARQRFTARSYQTFRDFLMSFHTVPRAFVTSWLRFYILIFHPQSVPSDSENFPLGVGPVRPTSEWLWLVTGGYTHRADDRKWITSPPESPSEIVRGLQQSLAV